MKELISWLKYKKKRSKNNPVTAVNRFKAAHDQSELEKTLSIPIIAILSLVGVGLLAFLTTRLQKVAVRQPILLENRQIVYKRNS